MDKFNLIAVGGGTGLSTLLRGLKRYEDFNLTAIVTITDEGGSSGMIRREMNIPPPGDIRNNITALAEDEKLLTQLIRYRFSEEGSLMGHSLGNIILAALTRILGSFPEAVKNLAEVLAIQGVVLPVSECMVRLVAETEKGDLLLGENEIADTGQKIKRITTNKQFEALEETLEAFKNADGMVFGPGSLYTSVIPNFLAAGVKEAVNSNPCKKIYVANLMTQPGETIGYTLDDHLKEIEKYLDGNVDLVIANNGKIPEEILQRYENQNSEGLKLDEEKIERELILENLVKLELDERDAKLKLRHDEKKLAEIIRRYFMR